MIKIWVDGDVTRTKISAKGCETPEALKLAKKARDALNAEIAEGEAFHGISPATPHNPDRDWKQTFNALQMWCWIRRVAI